MKGPAAPGISTALAALTAAVLTATGAVHAAASESRRPQFACYPAQFSTFRPRRLTISDSIVTRLPVVVMRPLDVCAPSRVDLTRATDPAVYLTCAEISAPAVPRRSPGTVSNVFGTAKVTIETARSLCISSSRAAAGPTTLVLTCYGVVDPAGDSRRESTIGDAFATSRDEVAVGSPVRFCTEVRPRGSTAALQLMCYAVESETVAKTIVLSTGWGVLRASPGRRDRVCVQSAVRP